MKIAVFSDIHSNYQTLITGIDQSMHCLTTALEKWENDGGSGIWSLLPETYWEDAAAELGL
ncbi:hypothetical protein ACOAOT_18955 [Lacrimispora sp. AGF001]|uniref:hypothetical protein n=1 Tax=Lacrimispora sp. AGF001 TaxID=3401631 RepID=UPI003B42BEAF